MPKYIMFWDPILVPGFLTYSKHGIPKKPNNTRWYQNKVFFTKTFGVFGGGSLRGGKPEGDFFFRHMAHIGVRFQPENVGILKPTTSEPSADHPKIAG